MRCPLCETELNSGCDADVRPFCSPRCKKIDLSNWLEGKYHLPRELTPEELELLTPEKRDEAIAVALGKSTDRGLN